MKTYTAKQLHENPSEVYRAAAKQPVKITHRHHGDFILIDPSMLRGDVRVFIPGEAHGINIQGTIEENCECPACQTNRKGCVIKFKCNKGA